jgi:hypothetical protein
MSVNWALVTRNLVMVPNTGMAAAEKAEQRGYPGATALFVHLIGKVATGGQPEYDELAAFLAWSFTIAEVGAEERVVALQRLAEYELPAGLAAAVQAALILPESEEDPE